MVAKVMDSYLPINDFYIERTKGSKLVTCAVDCESYEDFEALPAALLVDDTYLLGKSAFNTDTGEAYYRSDRRVAKKQ